MPSSRKSSRPKKPRPSDDPAAVVGRAFRIDYRKLFAEEEPADPPAPSLDAAAVAAQVANQLAAVLPGLVRATVQELLPPPRQPGGADPLEALRKHARDELAAWEARVTEAAPPAPLRDNRALAGELLRSASLSGHLADVKPSDGFDAIAQAIRDRVLGAGPAETPQLSQTTRLPTDTAHKHETSHETPPPADSGRFREVIVADGPTLLSARREPEAVRLYAHIYRDVERTYPEVAVYNRLQAFAGCTPREIAALVNGNAEAIDSQLVDFRLELDHRLRAAVGP
jgi:hypothetical protein